VRSQLWMERIFSQQLQSCSNILCHARVSSYSSFRCSYKGTRAEQASSHDNISAINSSGVTGRAFPALNSS
jgi:hypothetical protein